MTTTDQLTFGVEFEINIPRDADLTIGRYHHGRAIPGFVGWRVESDASLSADSGYRACEIVSPILRGADGLAQVCRVLEYLRGLGAKVNSTCGMHVHVGVDFADLATQRKVVRMVANYETALFASTGSPSRQMRGWCRPIRNHQQTRDRAEGTGQVHDRYRSINLMNIENRRSPTVEFRVFAGTLNTTKAIGHICCCLGLVAKAHATKRAVKWEEPTLAAKSPVNRKSGLGLSHMARLFYHLGWTKGREPKVYGWIEGVEGAPDLAAVKKELRRLARKYDRGNDSQTD